MSKRTANTLYYGDCLDWMSKWNDEKKDHKLIPEKELAQAVKEILGAKFSKETLSENPTPTNEELNKKWRLIKR